MKPTLALASSGALVVQGLAIGSVLRRRVSRKMKRRVLALHSLCALQHRSRRPHRVRFIRKTAKQIMFKKILVPLDGPRRAEKILPHVEDLAHRYGKSQVVLLKVVEPIPVSVNLGDYVPAFEKEEIDGEFKVARAYLEELRARLLKKGILSHVHVRLGRSVQSRRNGGSARSGKKSGMIRSEATESQRGSEMIHSRGARRRSRAP